MYFELEYPICERNGRRCDDVFVVRGFKELNISHYFGVMTVIRRPFGLWEPTAWMIAELAAIKAAFEVLSDAFNTGYIDERQFVTLYNMLEQSKEGLEFKNYHTEAIDWLMGQGYRISGSFETKHLAAYRRLFSKAFDLKVIEIQNKRYNGGPVELAYTEFIKKEMTNGH